MSRAPDTSAASAKICVIGQDQLLFLGTSGRAMPTTGALQGEMPGSWTASVWQGVAETFGFAALAKGFDLGQRQHLVAASGTIEPPMIVGLMATTAEVVAELRRLGGPAADVLALLQSEVDSWSALSPQVLDLSKQLLAEASRHGGFVEMLGGIGADGLYLQGWSQALYGSAGPVVILDEQLRPFALDLAAFSREDLVEPARGFVATTRGLGGLELDCIERLYFRVDNNYYYHEIVAKYRTVLDPVAAVAALKRMLPVLDGTETSLDAFRRFCRPTFGGVDTLGELAAPVRAAMDCLRWIEGKGFYAAGWLIDPLGRVRFANLKSTANRYVRLADRWARRSRPDVTTAFAADRELAAHLDGDDHRHGFVAFVQDARPPAASERFYLEVVLHDESCGFLPLSLDQSPPTSLLQRLLHDIDPDDMAAEGLVENHLAPVIAGLAAARQSGTAERLALGTAPGTCDLTVVVPLIDAPPDPDSTLAALSVDSDFAGAEFLFVIGPGQAAQLAKSLVVAARFYGLSGSVLVTRREIDRAEAIEIGAAAARGHLLLFLDPAVMPRRQGWLRRLDRARRALPEPGPISPTLVYEDGSVRWAGTLLRGEEPIPVPAHTGRAVEEVSVGPPRRSASVCFAACLVTRALWQLSALPRAGILDPELRLALWARDLAAVEAGSWWLPEETLWFPELRAESSIRSRRVRSLVDRCTVAAELPVSIPVALKPEAVPCAS